MKLTCFSLMALLAASPLMADDLTISSDQNLTYLPTNLTVNNGATATYYKQGNIDFKTTNTLTLDNGILFCNGDGGGTGANGNTGVKGGTFNFVLNDTNTSTFKVADQGVWYVGKANNITGTLTFGDTGILNKEIVSFSGCKTYLNDNSVGSLVLKGYWKSSDGDFTDTLGNSYNFNSTATSVDDLAAGEFALVYTGNTNNGTISLIAKSASTPTPEPTTGVLLGLGIFSLALRRRVQRQK